jgi:hypothetical protein
MQHLPVLGPGGQHTFRFGGVNSWKQATYKDYIVSLEWFGPNGRSVDACMVIWNARKNSHDAGCYVIGRKQITLYCDEHMKPKPYALYEATRALPVLGRAPLAFEVNALIDTILHFADDLVQMPVAPPAARQALAQAAMFEVEHKDRNTGRILRESVI